MEEMKWDMGGAGAVFGAMEALARRGARANVVGILGLVENMPSGTAQRPGDVITAMSGVTIEVVNTDAEGRLVLADALHYAKEHFKPRLMIDLATLTGAIVVALGHEQAGLFTPDEELAGLHPELRDALFGARTLPFSISIQFAAFDGGAYARAVELARASDEYVELTIDGRLHHRARFYPGDRPLRLRDLYEVVADRPETDVLVDDKPIPYARELWLPLVWFLIR